jgi:cell division protein FtsI/penicillin-binding protein 2
MLIPYILTLIFVAIGISIALVLAWGAWHHRNPPLPSEAELPKDLKEFGPVATNRWIRGLRIFLALLILVVFGFHFYWVFRAGSSEAFAQAKLRDSRNIRLAESGLKGWVLDRTGELKRALVRYNYDPQSGGINRYYALGEGAIHLTGYSDFVLGAGGLEAAYRKWLTEPASTYNQLASPIPVGQDIQVSVDLELQNEAHNLLKQTGKPGAAIVLLLPNNEVLAMSSTPSFKPEDLRKEENWRRLTEQAEDYKALTFSPLVNRALGTLVTGGAAFYYRPGSTFKTFIAAVAIDTGMVDEIYTCKKGGFSPPGTRRTISDFDNHVHGEIGLLDAFSLSCNQYFAQLGIKLGKEVLADYAKRLQYFTAPQDSIERQNDLWNVVAGNESQFDYIFAPPMPKMKLNQGTTAYDIALQSIGQGFDDMTVMSMALLASAAASSDGALAAPTFETGATRKIIAPFISAESAGRLRQLMKAVVESGTAAAAFSKFGVSAGGKTGTADRPVTFPALDRNGIQLLDLEGKPVYTRQDWVDSWFMGFAPADNPRIAFAVVVENGGTGGEVAAPIAAALIRKAMALGLIQGGNAHVVATPALSQPSANRRR